MAEHGAKPVRVSAATLEVLHDTIEPWRVSHNGNIDVRDAWAPDVAKETDAFGPDPMTRAQSLHQRLCVSIVIHG